MNESVRIVEVGPRDGLQNEARPIPTDAKIAFIRSLAAAGLPEIEATSFVRPDRVPQLADAEAVLAGVGTAVGSRLSALVPNERGLDRALACGIRRIAVFTAASETFAERNIGMDIAASLAAFDAVARRALGLGLSVRGYVSTCFTCPYEGEIAPEAVVPVARALLELGCDQVSLGDTIGGAVPTDVDRLLDRALPDLPAALLALHFHDTSGTALANVAAGLRRGIRCFDSSAGGIGGCPFAPGAAGNLATEDLLYLLDRMGYGTGVSLLAVAAASLALEPLLGHALPGRVLNRFRGGPPPGGSETAPEGGVP